MITYHEKSKTFHLYNDTVSYIMTILSNGHMGQLYFGKKIRDKEDFSYLLVTCERPMTSYLYETDRHGHPIMGNILFVGEEWGSDGIDFCGIEDSVFENLKLQLDHMIEVMKVAKEAFGL